MPAVQTLLETKSITKQFPKVLANSDKIKAKGLRAKVIDNKE